MRPASERFPSSYQAGCRRFLSLFPRQVYGMPKETEEKAEKARVMAIVLKDACSVPMEIMEKCCEALQPDQRNLLQRAPSLQSATLV